MKKQRLHYACLIVILAATFLYACQSLERGFIEETEQKTGSQTGDARTVDAGELPACISKYFVTIGYDEEMQISGIHITYKNTFHKQNPVASPTLIKYADQYNYSDDPYRNYFMKGKMKGIPFQGNEKYSDGVGTMQISLLNLVKVVNISNTEMAKSSLVTYLAELALLPSGFLSNSIAWEEVDAYTVKATITDKANTVSGLFYFAADGKLVKFSSNDRYYIAEDNSYVTHEWIAEMGDYRIMDCGLLLPGYLTATWVLPDGPFLYFRGDIDTISYQ